MNLDLCSCIRTITLFLSFCHVTVSMNAFGILLLGSDKWLFGCNNRFFILVCRFDAKLSWLNVVFATLMT